MGHLHRHALLAGANLVGQLIAAGVDAKEAKQCVRDCPKAERAQKVAAIVAGIANAVANPPAGSAAPAPRSIAKRKRAKKRAKKAAKKPA